MPFAHSSPEAGLVFSPLQGDEGGLLVPAVSLCPLRQVCVLFHLYIFGVCMHWGFFLCSLEICNGGAVVILVKILDVSEPSHLSLNQLLLTAHLQGPLVVWFPYSASAFSIWTKVFDLHRAGDGGSALFEGLDSGGCSPFSS